MKKLLKKAVLEILTMAMTISYLSLIACGDSDKDTTLTFMAYQPASQVNQDKYKELLNKFTENDMHLQKRLTFGVHIIVFLFLYF